MAGAGAASRDPGTVAVCLSSGWTVIWLPGVIAGVSVVRGMVVTLQQGPWPEGTSETCVFACCLACIIIIGQRSPPQ
jgi:hypothetical protein